MPDAQVDLVLGAVQPEADRAVGLAAVKVVDEQGLYLLGHRCSLSLSGLIISLNQLKLTRAQLLR
jgi:hypothetical protein